MSWITDICSSINVTIVMTFLLDKTTNATDLYSLGRHRAIGRAKSASDNNKTKDCPDRLGYL